MNLTENEIEAIRALLAHESPDVWSQMSLWDLASHGSRNSVEDPYEFARKCVKLGIGDEYA